MLSPNARSLYTEALTPPPGMVFDEAIGTTFSMDPAVMLSVPVHLALLGGGQISPIRDGIAALEAVRRFSDHITLYCQRGRLQVPTPPHVLYGLLESMVVEVVAPRRGVFHPKVWLMRFTNPDEPGTVLLRFMVLSRNLTADRSWDIALTLEGRPTGRFRADNRSIGELIRRLPEMAFGAVDQTRKDQALRLSEEFRRTKWELPAGFESVSFHVLGLKRGGWRPPVSSRLVVISPFCRDSALRQLADTTSSADALVTRPETFADLAPQSWARFRCCYTLDEAAETEDGEDIDETATRDSYGLHAKVYIFERGVNTHIVVGSANATNAALLRASNVEVLTELTGKRSLVGGVERLLSADDLGEVLVELQESGEQPDTDPLQQAAEKYLEAARNAIAGALLRIRCAKADEGHAWNVRLVGAFEHLEGIAGSRAWPITVGIDHAVDLAKLMDDGHVDMGAFALASLTGMVAFELRAAARDQQIRFVLNLPVEGLSEDRDAAVLQTVVRNRAGFLRYLLLLIGDLGYGLPLTDADGGGTGDTWGSISTGGMPLLEELVRAYAREPSRLREVQRVVQRLTVAGDANDIVPQEFLDTWEIFERAMERRDD